MSCDYQPLVDYLAAAPGDKLGPNAEAGLTTSRAHLPPRPSSSSVALVKSALCAALLFRSWHCDMPARGRGLTAITIGKSLKTHIALGFDATLVAEPTRVVFAQVTILDTAS